MSRASRSGAIRVVWSPTVRALRVVVVSAAFAIVGFGAVAGAGAQTTTPTSSSIPAIPVTGSTPTTVAASTATTAPASASSATAASSTGSAGLATTGIAADTLVPLGFGLIGLGALLRALSRRPRLADWDLL